MALPAQQARAARPRRAIWPGLAAQRVDARIERRVASRRGVDAHRAGDQARRAAAPRRANRPLERERGRDLRAVEQRQPLLGAERQRRRGRCGASASAAGSALAPQARSRPRRSARAERCASGARSPEAPTEPCAGMHRQDVGVAAARSSASTTARPHAGVAARQAGDLQQQDQAHACGGQRRADAGHVREHEAALQLARAGRAGCAAWPGCRSRC